MRPEKGAVHIPVILAALAVVTALVYFKDEVKNFIPAGEKTAEFPVVEQSEEKEIFSAFGDLITQEQQTLEEATEPKEVEVPPPAETDECDLTKYMIGPESSMDFIGIMAPFPEKTIVYPPDWPEGFIYPEEFKLVEQSSGKLTEESAMMYKASIIFEGKPPEATCEVIKYFEGKNWTISELVNRDDLGFIVVLQDADGVGTGLLNVEVGFQNYERSQIGLSVFPDAAQSE